MHDQSDQKGGTMRGFLLISHGPFSFALKESVEMIAGEREEVFAVSLLHADGPESLQAKILDTLAKMTAYDEIFVLVDMLGGSPGNSAFAVLEKQKNMTLLAGMNFPMLLTAVLTPDMSSAELIDVSKEGIVDVKAFVASMSDDED